MHNDTVETLIGAAVIAVAVFFLVFAYRSTGSADVSGYELTANLSRVDGIAVGTDVRLSGIKVGAVSALTLNPNYLVTVHMNIRNDVQIPADSSLVVTSAGLLGSSYLSISPGGSDKMLASGGVIRNTQGSLDMMGLLSRFVGGGTSGSSSNSGGSTTEPKP
ncbi:MAG: outer membrane lipid asymmetry maintenance protein MlaD [Alphaproteobacteria bacterium]|nr:outer membrane lipid asymmetry maintenance protein MlaD [Alphaproteobacteria bacterium]MDE1985775.1 outer membrane lipid asymmetry maintenance protein MlaD [Alphaproteobacteria bacterium]MDE2163791.1 outer membrane lipid asymmetry maintenance protein MlaD [Alphaproteobacteria bacterium]MDE2264315.1 outer membrane lipid asymmetry maintenance protein MlaD [Alphaproteobacteria bacterium]